MTEESVGLGIGEGRMKEGLCGASGAFGSYGRYQNILQQARGFLNL